MRGDKDVLCPARWSRASELHSPWVFPVRLRVLCGQAFPPTVFATAQEAKPGRSSYRLRQFSVPDQLRHAREIFVHHAVFIHRSAH